ncbi:MAG: hypothetical protein AAF664_03120 [Planctomycetota bacterium]
MFRLFFTTGLFVLILQTTGCQTLRPQPIVSQTQYIPTELASTVEHQVEVGEPNVVLDSVGWVVGIPGKIILWDRRVDNHQVSPKTTAAVADYLHTNHLPHIKVRANQYAPMDEFKRLTQNKTVAWPYRYTLGLYSVVRDAVLPGRIFGGDNFNPYTQSIHLYSDIPAIALHEGAHAKDFARREYQGTYALAYNVVPLYHETVASRDALAYAHVEGDAAMVEEANRILYPAYGTYVGSTLGTFAGPASGAVYAASVLGGHIEGRLENQRLREGKTHLDIAYSTPTRPANPVSPEPTTQLADQTPPGESVMPVSFEMEGALAR